MTENNVRPKQIHSYIGQPVEVVCEDEKIEGTQRFFKYDGDVEHVENYTKYAKVTKKDKDGKEETKYEETEKGRLILVRDWKQIKIR